MKVYSLEETLNLIDYYSKTTWSRRLDVLLNTQIEDKEYDNDTVNKLFIVTIGCIESCFNHYNVYGSTGLQLFVTSEMMLVINKIKEKVKPLFIINVIPVVYDSDTIFMEVTIHNTTRYYEFIMKSGFKTLKEETYVHYLDLIETKNNEKLGFIPLKEMEF